MKKQNLIASYLLVLVVAFSRLAPHPLGFTPIGALGLFSGTYMDNRWSWCVPLVALLIGDAITGFYNSIVMISVYIGFAISACIGKALLRKKRTFTRMGSAIFISALIFFILSNTSSWWVYYPHTLDGLLLCYINGIPYFGRAMLADTFYCAILFGAYEYFQRWSLRSSNAKTI